MASMRGRVPIRAVLACAAFAGLLAIRAAQATPEPVSRGITESVDDIMAREAAPAAEREAGPPASPGIPGTSFKAIGQSESGFIPPDTAGDVGPTQIVVHANGRIKVFAKTGAPGALNTTALSFWTSVANGSQPISPQVRYDRLSGRWILLAVTSVKPNNRIMIAVQTSPGTISSTSSFTFYQFDQSAGGGSGDTSNYCEFPKLGIDANALYVGCNMYTTAGALNRITVYVIRKSSIVPGPGPLVVTAFRDISNGATGPGPFGPVGVDNDDPQASVGYFVGIDMTASGQLQLRRVQDPGGTPTLSGNITLTVPATTQPISQPASNSSPNLDSGDDRLSRASLHKNKLTGATSLWTSHAMEVDATCAGVVGGGRNGVRWYEIGGSAPTSGDPLAASPMLLESGTLCDPSADPKGYIYPSVAASGQGAMALGSSFAGASVFAGAAAAGRWRTDASGVTQTPTTLQSGLAPYVFVANGRNRWGDYSFTGLDPGDDQTLWTFQEYADSTRNNWAVRAVQLKAPPPPSLSGLQLVTCVGLASVPLTISGAQDQPSVGSEFFDPGADPGGPGFSGHLAGSATGGVALNGAPALVLPPSPQTQPVLQVAVSLNTTSATAGLKNLTIRNPDQQATTGVGLVRVDPMFTPAPSNNGPVCLGGTLQLSVAAATGATYAWTGPNGFSSSLQNPTIPNVTAAAAGVYTVAINGTGCPLPSGSTTVQIHGENASCEDGNACTTGDTCHAGTCQPGPALICDDGNVCTSNSCDPATGCVFTDTTAVQCDDQNVCTNDLCDPTTGCFHSNNTAPCNDGNPCTTGDTCAGGSCQPGGPTNCNDNNACTADGCDPATGCTHTDQSAACNDGNICTDDSCNPAVGCVYTNNTAPCNDNNACTTGDTCGGGSCHPGAPTNCNDGNPCTDDNCNPVSGCFFSTNAASCSDGNACTTGDFCSHRTCHPGTPVVCNDNNVCTTDSCNPATGCVFADNSASCDDGNPCTADSCDPVQGCLHADNPAACDDHNVCTTDSCDPVTGCSHAANTAACEDGNPCTTGDTCGGGVCHPGDEVVCDDHNACTHDECNPASGCVYLDLSQFCVDDNPCTDDSCDPAVGCINAFNEAPCDDGDICTTDDFCYQGGCAGGFDLNCDDGNICTADSCNPAIGCVHTYAPQLACDDNDVCTIDECDAVTGCYHTPSTAPCDDGNPCTTGDKCAGGSCRPGPGTLDCSDGNPCTTDGCNPVTGCFHANNANPCDDGNACTTGDFCSHKICQPGTLIVCNDNNPCTSDSCNPASGCVFTDNSAACNDGNPCTDDHCDPHAGCVFTNNTASCDDGNLCTVGDTCSGGACVPGVASPPGEVAGLSLAGRTSTTLSWQGAAGNAVYDVVTSAIGELQINGTSPASCLANDVAATSLLDPQASPGAGEGYYYLVRVQNECGTGSYGFSSSQLERVPAAACP